MLGDMDTRPADSANEPETTPATTPGADGGFPWTNGDQYYRRDGPTKFHCNSVPGAGESLRVLTIPSGNCLSTLVIGTFNFTSYEDFTLDVAFKVLQDGVSS